MADPLVTIVDSGQYGWLHGEYFPEGCEFDARIFGSTDVYRVPQSLADRLFAAVVAMTAAEDAIFEWLEDG